MNQEIDEETANEWMNERKKKKRNEQKLSARKEDIKIDKKWKKLTRNGNISEIDNIYISYPTVGSLFNSYNSKM